MRTRQLLAIGALVLGSSVAMAGLVNEFPVAVTLNPDGSGTAAGNMATARFSKDIVQYIGCGIRRFDDGVGGVLVFGFCQASTATGVVGFCESENPALLASVGDQDDYSFITFSWNADGECLSIGNSTQSFYIPK
jgi:hypothetical protein